MICRLGRTGRANPPDPVLGTLTARSDRSRPVSKPVASPSPLNRPPHTRSFLFLARSAQIQKPRRGSEYLYSGRKVIAAVLWPTSPLRHRLPCLGVVVGVGTGVGLVTPASRVIRLVVRSSLRSHKSSKSSQKIYGHQSGRKRAERRVD
jgi:hypothetical protein